MVPAESETSGRRNLFKVLGWIGMVKTPTSEPELTKRLAAMMANKTLDMMTFQVTFITETKEFERVALDYKTRFPAHC